MRVDVILLYATRSCGSQSSEGIYREESVHPQKHAVWSDSSDAQTHTAFL